MNYSIEWHPKVRDFLRKLQRDIANRIVKKIDSILQDPFHYLEHYEGNDLYKLRIGEYRALIDIDFTNKIIKIQVLGHRKDIYERLK